MKRSYSKYNEDTKQTTELPKDVAISEANTLNEEQEDYYMNLEPRAVPFGIIDNESNIPGKFKDSSMEMTHAAAPKEMVFISFLPLLLGSQCPASVGMILLARAQRAELLFPIVV